MKIQDLAGKRICMLGFGREGQATVRALEQYAPGCRITIADQNQELEIKNYECRLGLHYLDHLDQFDVIIKSPGIPPFPELTPHVSRLTSSTQIFLDTIALSGATVIGVTGSKGKSTTATLIADILRTADEEASLIGNIGDPAIAHLGEMLCHPDPRQRMNKFFVHEMSSYQLADLTRSPPIAVITTFFPEHLDYHASIGLSTGCTPLEAYKEAKKHITRFQRRENIVIYNAASPGAKEIADESAGRRIPYSAQDSPVRIEETHLIGTHNLSNIAAAWKVSEELGVPRAIAIQAIKNFQGLPHRLQSLGVHHGIEWIDDAISTTPESTIAALDALGGRVRTLILGGQDRGFDFSNLGRRIAASSVECVILFPGSGPRIRKALENTGTSAQCFDVQSMDAAVQVACSKTLSSSVAPIILLSPASPSYGMFKNFEEKGDTFHKTIIMERNSAAVV